MHSWLVVGVIQEYVHQTLGQEIIATGGHYVVTEENRLPFKEREVLYLKGYALIDTSCCGLGGCPFVHVKGSLLEWKSKVDVHGQDVSLVESISDERLKQSIHKTLQEKEVFHQIRFD